MPPISLCTAAAVHDDSVYHSELDSLPIAVVDHLEDVVLLRDAAGRLIVALGLLDDVTVRHRQEAVVTFAAAVVSFERLRRQDPVPAEPGKVDHHRISAACRRRRRLVFALERDHPLVAVHRLRARLQRQVDVRLLIVGGNFHFRVSI